MCGAGILRCIGKRHRAHTHAHRWVTTCSRNRHPNVCCNQITLERSNPNNKTQVGHLRKSAGWREGGQTKTQFARIATSIVEPTLDTMAEATLYHST